jgi:hypothetical protein
MEAIYEFEVVDMPVAVDTKGTSVHQTGAAEWKVRIESSLGGLPILQWVVFGESVPEKGPTNLGDRVPQRSQSPANSSSGDDHNDCFIKRNIETLSPATVPVDAGWISAANFLKHLSRRTKLSRDSF